MDDLKGLNPGKLRRKNKRSQSESFMKLPDLEPTSGNFTDGEDLVPSSEMPPKTGGGDLLSDESFDDLFRSPQENVPKPSSPQPSLDAGAPVDTGEAESERPGAWIKTARRDEKLDLSAEPVESRDATVPAESPAEDKAASPLDLLQAPAASGQRDDIRRIPLSSRRRAAAQPSTPPSDPSTDAVESTIQKATRAADKTLDALSQLQIAIDRTERRSFFNSIGAYVLFCIILSVTLYFALNSSAKTKYAFNAVKAEQLEAVVKDKKFLEDAFERDQRASSEAFEVFQLIQDGHYVKAIERYNKVLDHLTHPAETALLGEKIDSILWKLADTAYRDGRQRFDDGNYEQARDAFNESLSYQEKTPYSDSLHYHLAMSLYNLGDFEGARAHFAIAMEGQLNSELDAKARYFRAIAAEKVGNIDEAARLYDQFLKKYRYNKYADDAAKNRARIERIRPKE